MYTTHPIFHCKIPLPVNMEWKDKLPSFGSVNAIHFIIDTIISRINSPGAKKRPLSNGIYRSFIYRAYASLFLRVARKLGLKDNYEANPYIWDELQKIKLTELPEHEVAFTSEEIIQKPEERKKVAKKKYFIKKSYRQKTTACRRKKPAAVASKDTPEISEGVTGASSKVESAASKGRDATPRQIESAVSKDESGLSKVEFDPSKDDSVLPEDKSAEHRSGKPAKPEAFTSESSNSALYTEQHVEPATMYHLGQRPNISGYPMGYPGHPGHRYAQLHPQGHGVPPLPSTYPYPYPHPFHDKSLSESERYNESPNSHYQTENVYKAGYASGYTCAPGFHPQPGHVYPPHHLSNNENKKRKLFDHSEYPQLSSQPNFSPSYPGYLSTPLSHGSAFPGYPQSFPGHPYTYPGFPVYPPYHHHTPGRPNHPNSFPSIYERAGFPGPPNIPPEGELKIREKVLKNPLVFRLNMSGKYGSFTYTRIIPGAVAEELDTLRSAVTHFIDGAESKAGNLRTLRYKLPWIDGNSPLYQIAKALMDRVTSLTPGKCSIERLKERNSTYLGYSKLLIRLSRKLGFWDDFDVRYGDRFPLREDEFAGRHLSEIDPYLRHKSDVSKRHTSIVRSNYGTTWGLKNRKRRLGEVMEDMVDEKDNDLPSLEYWNGESTSPHSPKAAPTSQNSAPEKSDTGENYLSKECDDAKLTPASAKEVTNTLKRRFESLYRRLEKMS